MARRLERRSRVFVEELEPGPEGDRTATLSFIPTAARTYPVRVVAGDVHADALVTIDDTPWRVLAHDARPCVSFRQTCVIPAGTGG